MSTTSERLAAQKRHDIEKQAFDVVDDRFGSSSFLQKALDHIFPDHWSFMVGEVAMYSFVILVITGIYLALFYSPSDSDVVYRCTAGQHCYLPLVGQHMSEAYRSVIQISFNVRGGLVFRQVHHWAANVFLAAIVFHLCRVFFTGAFRKPREINWIIGLTLLLVSMLEGFSGYSLPDDLLSGTGLRVFYSIVLAVPVVGQWVALDLWGGQFPGTTFFARLFVVHEFLFPLLIAGLLGAHLAIIWRQGHTDFPGPGKTETNIRGSRVWPQYALKSGALFCMVFAVLGGLGGYFQINPIWLYGPYSPYKASAGSQPDWYVGWLDGALRLMPHWEFRSLGVEIANPFFPGLLMPGVVFTIMYAWPWIDKLLNRDTGHHNLLDRPRDKPARTAIGVAALFFFIDLTVACADDLLANDFHVPFERIVEILRFSIIFGPIVAAAVTYQVCRSLQRTDAHPITRPVGGFIVRHADGSYHSLGVEEADGHGAEANGHGNEEQEPQPELAEQSSGPVSGGGSSGGTPAAPGETL